MKSEHTPHDEVPDIECLASEVIYQNRWLKVREDRIRRRSGATGIYGVVEKPDFVVIVPLQDDALYLVQQFRYPVGARFWELPQGAWEGQPDATPESVAVGELREETGLVAGAIRDAGHLFLAYGFCNQGYRVFLATDLAFEGDARDAEEEDLVARRFPLRDVERMICEGEIKDATTIAALGLLRMKGWL
ncbi:NUDIX hydrolase [Niveibacterium umoris]|uniref:GDP-mannose pyrophosphatase n=1 Tax=Niveibacterium umoris TaxID=1193620 RepID=A0A840BMU4_9RHOO|nr:NUDIX hydrolase [Niveibacterium umoris]MBB4013963.1 ADP-ribose pyrophosphatase [Niveibacterium umoris]